MNYSDPGLTVQVNENSFAVFSADLKYRYRLVRVFKKPDFKRVIFIMLNPSTADAFRNDPTVARCCAFAKKWGFDSIEILNVFAFRSTDPQVLYTYKEIIGDRNDQMITDAITSPIADLIIAAWGNHARIGRRSTDVCKLVTQNGKKLHALKLNGEGRGEPGHPLYLRADLTPVLYVG